MCGLILLWAVTRKNSIGLSSLAYPTLIWWAYRYLLSSIGEIVGQFEFDPSDVYLNVQRVYNKWSKSRVSWSNRALKRLCFFFSVSDWSVALPRMSADVPRTLIYLFLINNSLDLLRRPRHLLILRCQKR